MKNKVLIRLTIPEIDCSYDIFIPVNEIVWKVKKLIIKSISDLTVGAININMDFILINKNNEIIYNNNSIVIDTDIRNATELIMMLIKK